MKNNTENPGELNGSQVQNQQSSENKKVRNLSKYGVYEGLWVSLYRDSTFIIALNIDQKISDTLTRLELEGLSFSQVYQDITTSTIAYECYTPEARQMFLDNLLDSSDLYIDIRCLANDPNMLSVDISNSDRKLESFKIKKLP